MQRLVAVAASGGRDSTALLHASCHAARLLGLEVLAMHVHHGLMPEADAWLARLELEQLVQVLGMTRQREAQLLVRRQGTAKLMQFTMTPEELQSPSVDRSFALEAGVGYVRATSFDPMRPVPPITTSFMVCLSFVLLDGVRR